MTPPVLAITGLRKAWAGRPVLDGVELRLDRGAHTLVQGASGTGKSTLLGILARLVRPDSGQVALDGQDILGLGSATRYRREKLGIIFQDPQLVDSLTAFQNIEMASLNLRGAGSPPDALLERLDLGARRGARAGVLSRGERQRLAIARAFVGRPRVVLADEPTASLDPASRDAVLAQVFALADAAEATVVLVSHDPEVARNPAFEHRITLERGRLCKHSTARKADQP